MFCAARTYVTIYVYWRNHKHSIETSQTNDFTIISHKLKLRTVEKVTQFLQNVPGLC